jgi:hypothetical protein
MSSDSPGLAVPGDGSTVMAVEWALHGMRPSEKAGYHLLACSNGRLSSKNFMEIIDRFTPGTLDSLPQVTVSYVASGSGYVGLAIHEAEEGGAGRLGNRVTHTRYFCLPYDQLAAGAVSYLSLYDALRDIRPSDEDKFPRKVTVKRGMPTAPAEPDRSFQAAMLLLTGNPVCIVGADPTSMVERLSFIDAVMSWLPYGMRSSMTAATFASSTYRQHRFRLFFSETARKSPNPDREDHLIRWGEMDFRLASGSKVNVEHSREYSEWLNSLATPPLAALARETGPMSFKEQDIGDFIGRIQERERDSGQPAGDGSLLGRIERALRRCGQSMDDGHPGRLRSDVRELLGVAGPAEALGDRQRQRLRVIVAEKRLLRDGLRLGDQAADFYGAILRVAFPPDLNYQAYCQVEDMADGRPPRDLLRVLGRLPGADPAVKVIVRYLSEGDRERGYLLEELVAVAASRLLRQHHARIVVNLTVQAAARARRAQIAALLPKLQQQGYFAALVQSCDPDNLQHQVDLLTSLLGTVHGTDLGDDACREILVGSHPHVPTVALLLAVCQLARPGDMTGILTDFMLGLVRAPGLSAELRRVLVARGVQGAPGPVFPKAAGPGPGTPGGTEVSETRQDVTTGQPPSAPNGPAFEFRAGLRENDRSGSRRGTRRGRFPMNPSGELAKRYERGQE